MARKASPWYWEQRNLWMVTIGGTRHRLGDHPDGAPRPQKSKKTGAWNAPKAISDAYHKLMRGERPTAPSESVAAVLDGFLDWTQENRAERTYSRYKDFIDLFCKSYGLVRVNDLSTAHVTTWLADQESWGSTTKRNAITALQRGFNWAVKNRGLSRNPIKGMEKPEAKKRTTVVTPAEFEAILKTVKDEPFRFLLIVSYDSGARPQEVKRLEARHVQLEKQRAVIPAEEAKGGIPRAIYFPTERSLAVIKKLTKMRPDGPLFLNNRGNPWSGAAIKCRFEDMDETFGRRINHYAFRHSFITRKLLAGVDSHVVAALSGHRDTKMIDSTYSHVAHDSEFMLKEAQREKPAVRGGRKSKA